MEEANGRISMTVGGLTKKRVMVLPESREPSEESDKCEQRDCDGGNGKSPCEFHGGVVVYIRGELLSYSASICECCPKVGSARKICLNADA